MSTALKKGNRFKEIPSKIATPYLTKTDVFFQSPDLCNTKKKKNAKPSVSSQATFKMKGKRAGHGLYLFVWLFVSRSTCYCV